MYWWLFYVCCLCILTAPVSATIARTNDCLRVDNLCESSSSTEPLLLKNGVVNYDSCSFAPTGVPCFKSTIIPPSPVEIVHSFDYYVSAQIRDPLSNDILVFARDQIFVFREATPLKWTHIDTINFPFSILTPTFGYSEYRNNPITEEPERMFIFSDSEHHSVFRMTIPSPLSVKKCESSLECAVNYPGENYPFKFFHSEYTYDNITFEVLFGEYNVSGKDSSLLDHPYASVDPATKNIFIADRGNNRILLAVYNETSDSWGGLITVLQREGPLCSATGLYQSVHAIVDPVSGVLLICDLYNHRVVMLLPDASSSSGFASESITIVGNDSCFSGAGMDELYIPHFLIVDPLSTDLFVLEYGGRVIKRFARLPGDPALTHQPFMRTGTVVAGEPQVSSPWLLNSDVAMDFNPTSRFLHLINFNQVARAYVPRRQTETVFGQCYAGVCFG